jgi:flagellar biosynthesis protein FlhF
MHWKRAEVVSEMMRRQVFRGRTLGQARQAAEQVFGSGAVLLTTREVRRPGLAGMLGTTEIEVVAAAAEPEAPAPPSVPPPPPSRASTQLFAHEAYAADRRADAPSSVATLRNELRSELRALKTGGLQADRGSPDILAELAALRVAIEDATPALRLGDEAAAMLRRLGIEGTAAAGVARWLKGPDDGRALSERMRDALSEVVKVSAWPLATEGRAVIALTGPTGVGKTTTIAKLAAHAILDRRSVTLITCDGFRVGAVEQLQRYASLLDAEFASATSPDELARCLDAATTDLVFVDTAGRRPQADAAESLLSAKSFGDRAFARHVLLCLPAALRAQDAAAVVKTFSALDPTALVVTKLDETTAPSGLLHGSTASGLPVSVLCAGQEVPEHIAQATLAAILDQLVPRAGSRGSAP